MKSFPVKEYKIYAWVANEAFGVVANNEIEGVAAMTLSSKAGFGESNERLTPACCTSIVL